MPNGNLAKRKLICSQQGLNPQPLKHKAIAQPIQPIHIYDNSYNFRLSLSLLTFKYINKIMHKLK